MTRVEADVATEDGELGTAQSSASTRIVGPVAPGPAAPSPPTLPLVPPTGGSLPAVPVIPPTRAMAPVVASTTVTAEIPVVMVSAGRREEYVEPTWYKERRRAAPYGLRVLVWLLFFVLILGLAVIAIEKYHPTWLNFARNTKPTHPVALAPPTTTAPTVTSPASTTSVAPTGFRQLSSTAKGAVYSVPADTYVLVVSTHNPVWTTVNAPPGSKKLVFGQTITPKASPTSISLDATSKVTFSAQAESIVIKASGKVVGKITAPAEFPFTYTFQTSTP